tara:strand:+ start:1276 stop:1536 length:261 start_codon:yes stop_codon:yes gene_type:complete
MTQQKEHWLTKKITIKFTWIIFFIMLILTLLMNFFVQQYNFFWIDGTFGFYAWYGFLVCVGLVLFSKILSMLISRPDDYYSEENEE